MSEVVNASQLADQLWSRLNLHVPMAFRVQESRQLLETLRSAGYSPASLNDSEPGRIAAEADRLERERQEQANGESERAGSDSGEPEPTS